MKKEFKVKERGLFKPGSDKPFKVSRSGIELFVECPSCFYLNNRLGIRRPSGPPFNINKAVDALLKKEFDVHRNGKTPHPYMKQYGIDAVPFQHELMDEWRENFKGVRYVHEPTNLLITGAVDDIWQNPEGELIVVDYKATAKNGEVNLDSDWQMGYKRQMEVYQWLLRRLGFTVSSTGYFVYCNGRNDAKAFDGKVEFEVVLLPYTGTDEWIEGTLADLKTCLENPTPPEASRDCEFCGYATARAAVHSHVVPASSSTVEGEASAHIFL
jgi:CRISPR/Cas system-associated exonuclease Cas4 (RecB family)